MFCLCLSYGMANACLRSCMYKRYGDRMLPIALVLDTHIVYFLFVFVQDEQLTLLYYFNSYFRDLLRNNTHTYESTRTHTNTHKHTHINSANIHVSKIAASCYNFTILKQIQKQNRTKTKNHTMYNFSIYVYIYITYYVYLYRNNKHNMRWEPTFFQSTAENFVCCFIFLLAREWQTTIASEQETCP